jgi:hypothetical protein
MYKLWCLLVYGFIPKWSIIREGNITGNSRYSREPAYVGRYYILQCEQTGKIKRVNKALPGWL